jgi:hypothetical protein
MIIPSLARASRFGVCIPDPKYPRSAYPISSASMTTMFGFVISDMDTGRSSLEQETRTNHKKTINKYLVILQDI